MDMSNESVYESDKQYSYLLFYLSIDKLTISVLLTGDLFSTDLTMAASASAFGRKSFKWQFRQGLTKHTKFLLDLFYFDFLYDFLFSL